MSKFEDRVLDVVAPEVDRLMSLFQDSTREPSAHTIDDVYEVVKSIRDLTAEVKSEVNKIEHVQPSQSDDSSEPADEESKDMLDKLKDLLDEADRMYDEYGIDDIKRDVFNRWFSSVKEFVKLLYDKASGATQVVTNAMIRYWILRHHLKPISDNLETLKSTVDKDYQSIMSSEAKSFSDVKSMINRNNVHLSDLESQLIDCCQNTSDTLSDIQDKISELQPATTSNNTLEILAKQKAILSALDEIRGLL